MFLRNALKCSGLALSSLCIQMTRASIATPHGLKSSSLPGIPLQGLSRGKSRKMEFCRQLRKKVLSHVKGWIFNFSQLRMSWLVLIVILIQYIATRQARLDSGMFSIRFVLGAISGSWVLVVVGGRTAHNGQHHPCAVWFWEVQES